MTTPNAETLLAEARKAYHDKLHHEAELKRLYSHARKTAGMRDDIVRHQKAIDAAAATLHRIMVAS